VAQVNRVAGTPVRDTGAECRRLCRLTLNRLKLEKESRRSTTHSAQASGPGGLSRSLGVLALDESCAFALQLRGRALDFGVSELDVVSGEIAKLGPMPRCIVVSHRRPVVCPSRAAVPLSLPVHPSCTLLLSSTRAPTTGPSVRTAPDLGPRRVERAARKAAQRGKSYGRRSCSRGRAERRTRTSPPQPGLPPSACNRS
jgi:hypothetical protein